MTTIDWTNRCVQVDRDTFGRAVAELKTAIGEQYVTDSAADLERAARATVPDPKKPSLIIYPGNATEVATAVAIANRYQLPLWPCSSGRNWGYGSATPVLENTAILHLRRMNRILEVNDELAYAVIEPGVSYRQLRDYLELNHSDLWCDSTDGPPEGSVIGNALDRGLGVTHYADHFGTLCGLEVVLPSGEVIRTGGGPKHCATWHTHKWGVGPYIEGLFSQGNFGVVTKAGVWLIPRPEAFASFTFDLSRPEDLPKLVDVIREMALRGILNSACHLINDVVTLSVLAQYPADMLDKYSRLPDDVLDEMRKRLKISHWSLGGGIQGSRKMVRLVKEELRKRLGPLGRIMFLDEGRVKGVETLNRLRQRSSLRMPIDWAVRTFAGKSPEMLQAAPHIHSVLTGRPSDYFVRHAYFKSRLPKPDIADPDRDNVGLIWFAPIAPMTGGHIQKVLDICRPLFRRYEFDFYAALLMQNPRSMIVLMSIFFLKEDQQQVLAAKELYEQLSRATSAATYQPYRVSVLGMGHLTSVSPESARFVRMLKSAVDPQGILAAGKYGI